MRPVGSRSFRAQAACNHASDSQKVIGGPCSDDDDDDEVVVVFTREIRGESAQHATRVTPTQEEEAAVPRNI